MPEKEKPLPRPPATPFGFKKRFEQPGDESMLVSDKLAMAMAEGKLDEFMKEEMSASEQSRKLAMMMMSMTGMTDMMPPDLAPVAGKDSDKEKPAAESTGAGTEPKNDIQPPEDLVKAAAEGDVKGLMQMLKREHEKNNAGAAEISPAGFDAGQSAAKVVEREVVESLAAIADENSLAMDWLIMRALKLYVQEYKKTGRL
jgi:hypothetical protein